MMSQSAAAPEKIRAKVNVAASMLVCFSAARQRSELLANAIIASDVRMKIREDFIASLRTNTKRTPSIQHPTSKSEVRGRSAFVPALAAMAAPAAREMKPVTAMILPIPILVISAGSGSFFDQSRQNTTAPARQLTDRIESSVISHVVGILRPKKTRFALLSPHTR